MRRLFSLLGFDESALYEERTRVRSKFPVAADPDQSIMKSYDAVLTAKPEYANRTSYVISPGGEIIYSYTDLQPDKHVENTLGALRKWAVGKNQH